MIHPKLNNYEFLLNQANIISKWIFDSGSYEVAAKPEEILPIEAGSFNKEINKLSKSNSIEKYLMNIRPLTSTLDYSKFDNIIMKSKSPEPEYNKAMNRNRFIMNMTSFSPKFCDTSKIDYHKMSSKLIKNESIHGFSYSKEISNNSQARNERVKTELQKFKLTESCAFTNKTPLNLSNTKMSQSRRNRNMNNSLDLSYKFHSTLK